MIPAQTYGEARRQGTITLVPPVGNPVDATDAKRQLRVEDGDADEDEHIETLVAAAHRAVENMLGFPILRQTRQTQLYGFPLGAIWLGGGDALTVGQVRYYDAANVLQTLSPSQYIADAVSIPAMVCAAPNASWPETAIRPGAVMVDWIAGWASAATVPADIKHAMKLLIAHWFNVREDSEMKTIGGGVQSACDALLEPWRVHSFG